MEPVENFLAHYGVKGMKWGVRRDRSARAVEVNARAGKRVKTKGGQNQGPSEDAIRVATFRQVARKSSTDALDNRQLQEVVQRMNLEQQYANLNRNNVGMGKKVARLILGQVGDQQVNELSTFATQRSGNPAVGTAARVSVGVVKSAVGVSGGGGGKKKK